MTKTNSIDFEVRKTGRTFGVFAIEVADGKTTETLVEGGFFRREAAEASARDYLNDAVEGAERAAGWDASR